MTKPGASCIWVLVIGSMTNANANAPAATGFYALPHNSLARLGVDGRRLAIFCIDDKLQIRSGDGESGGIDVAAKEVAFLRFGLIVTRHNSYHVARLKRTGDSAPLLLMPESPRDPAFASTMRSFAHAVSNDCGTSHLESGLTASSAWLNLALVTVVALAAALMALFVWADDFGRTGAWLFVALMAAVVAGFTWQTVMHELPRPLSSLDQLEQYLPR